MGIGTRQDKARKTHTIAGEAQFDKSSEKETGSIFGPSLLWRGSTEWLFDEMMEMREERKIVKQ
jgi:hypothetical protein